MDSGRKGGRIRTPPRYFRQGEHDGLCGFYAVFNAFRSLQWQTGHHYLRDDDSAFFDEAVECLARVPGTDIRVLKNNYLSGGTDPLQIRALCEIFAERIDLNIEIEFATSSSPIPFRRGYQRLFKQSEKFAMIVVLRDGSHWMVATPKQRDTYFLVDGGAACSVRFGAPTAAAFAQDAMIVVKGGALT